jgi:hypothetical protein
MSVTYLTPRYLRLPLLQGLLKRAGFSGPNAEDPFFKVPGCDNNACKGRYENR